MYRGTHFKGNEGFEANWMYVVRGILAEMLHPPSPLPTETKP